MSDPTHSEVLQFVQEQSCPFVTSSDVAGQFPDVSGRTVRKRLNDLVKRGEIQSRKIGAGAKVWYLECDDSLPEDVHDEQ